MDQILLFLAGWLAMVPSPSLQGAYSQNTLNAAAYELYSWRDAHDDWVFSLVPAPSGSPTRPEFVFNKKFVLHGTRELKQRIAGLSEGATILWFDRIPNTTQKEKVGATFLYPPHRMMEEIKDYGKTRKIAIEVVPAGGGQ